MGLERERGRSNGDWLRERSLPPAGRWLVSELREARISEEHTHHRGAACKRDSWMEIDVDRQVEWTSEADASVAVDMLRPLVGGARRG